ncbi:MAG TPA: 30S ribosomal protein S6 [Hyphomicrobiales bacterium]|nr:30S ribosomal protein S6 [Hyphomicrobiales bacterium]
MPHYEHVFLARPDVSAQQVEQLVETYKSLIADNGGAVSKSEYWGLKNIAYRINKNRKAHYTLMNITAPPPALAEMERQMRLNEDVMRFLTIRVDELEEGPSAMMRREARDDRRGPRRDGDRDRRPRGRPPERSETGPAKEAAAETAKPAKSEPKAEAEASAESKPDKKAETEAS